MYSGTTLTDYSGRIMGAHQKIDRVARRHLDRLMPAAPFPTIRSILHFEGGHGPDAIKRKSPARDEPWHYFNPFDEADDQLLKLIGDHYLALIKALKEKDEIKAAFEAAWLAHAVVDGLTPAHHYPYEEKLVELRGGRSIETRTTIKDKLVLPGDTKARAVRNNWMMWGPKGLFTTHGAFEWGFAVLIAPLRLTRALPAASEIERLQTMGVEKWFRLTAQNIARLSMYDQFYSGGWTARLARQVRRQLAPDIVRAVTLVWHSAAAQASR